MLVSTAASLINLAGIRLTDQERLDPAQAKEAIDAARALLPLCPEEAVGAAQGRALPGADAVREGDADARRAGGGGKGARRGAREDLDAARLVIGVFGGTGFYRFLDEVEEVPVATPYGPPSAPVRVGRVEGTEVAFMPRHGDEHTLPPHRINYRANLWAMQEVGVRRVVGPAACGSLKPELPPGTFVICDQFVDRTQARESTFYDGPQTTHVSAADPFCADLGDTLGRQRGELGIPVVRGGTVVVIQGPRFSTRAESRWFAAAGWDVVNMTQYPECWLARELGLCYANVALVTDYDVGLEGLPEVEPVSTEVAFAVFRENLDRLRALLVPGGAADRAPAAGRLRHGALRRDRPIDCPRSFPGGVGGVPDPGLQRSAHDRPLTEPYGGHTSWIS